MAISDSSSSITHEIVEETDHLPVFFSTPAAKTRTGFYGSFTSTRMIPVHWHEYLEFIYLKDGQMSATVQADTYELFPGDLLIINSGELHMTRQSAGPAAYVLIQLAAGRLREIFPKLELLHFTTCIRREQAERTPGLTESLDAMQMLFEEHADGYQLLLTSHLYQFLHILYRNFSTWSLPADESFGGRDLKRITDIVAWTQQHFREPLTLDMAAGVLGISREYFCRIFKKYTNQTYLDFLCATRTMNLYEELKTSDLSLPLLMEQNGLTNYKTFIRTFRELYGDTPRKIRQNFSKKD